MVETLTIAALHHAWHERRYQSEWCDDVEVEHSRDILERDLVACAEREDPGVVDEHVDLAGGVCELLRATGLGDVGGNEACPSTRRLDRGDDLSAAHLVATGHDHLCALISELLGGRSADA
jgi:hypothetical protein